MSYGLLGARFLYRQMAWTFMQQDSDGYGDGECDDCRCDGDCECDNEDKKTKLFGPKFGGANDEDKNKEITKVTNRLYDLTSKGNLNLSEDEKSEKSELLRRWRSLTGRTDKPGFML